MICEKISVIIPFYSGVKWLFEAVDSVLSQTYNNIEIIIINDGSQEDISEFLENYADKIIYLYQENKGAASARNLGIDICTGDFVAFIDSDDLWLPEKLEKQLLRMKKNNDVWSHTSYSTFGKNIESMVVNVSRYKGRVFPICIISCPIATPCVMIKSSILKEDKDLRFEVDMKSGEDSVFWLRLALSYKLSLIDEELTEVRIRGTNAALLAYSQIRARAQIWNKIKKNQMFNIKTELNFQVRFAFHLSLLIYSIVGTFGKDDSTKFNGIRELFSKILYVVPWLIFKNQKKTFLRE